MRDLTTARISLASILVLALCFAGVEAVNLKQCGNILQAAQQNATNGTSPAPVLRLSYEECVVKCGGGIGDITWGAFSQSFGAWFLPWIALMFQIPFGAECAWHFNDSYCVITAHRVSPQIHWRMSSTFL